MIVGCLEISLSPCRKDFIALTNPREPCWASWKIKFETTARMPWNLNCSHSLSLSTQMELIF